MPYGEVILKVSRDKNKPTVDTIFLYFRKSIPLNIKAKLLPKDETHWRPAGENFYKIKIISIERLENVEPYRRSGYSTPDYMLRGILLGMNNIRGEFPKYFSWASEGPEHEVRLFFNNRNGMFFEYGEYLTL